MDNAVWNMILKYILKQLFALNHQKLNSIWTRTLYFYHKFVTVTTPCRESIVFIWVTEILELTLGLCPVNIFNKCDRFVCVGGRGRSRGMAVNLFSIHNLTHSVFNIESPKRVE